MKNVFIHSSIKTRIETSSESIVTDLFKYVFIHSSIKTRIETISSLTENDIVCSCFYT